MESIEEMKGILEQKYIPNIPMARQRMCAIIPEELREQAFHYIHSHPASGHFGIIGTSTRAAKKFWWPSIGADVNRLVSKCEQCLAKLRKTDVKNCTHQPVQSVRPGLFIWWGPYPLQGLEYSSIS